MELGISDLLDSNKVRQAQQEITTEQVIEQPIDDKVETTTEKPIEEKPKENIVVEKPKEEIKSEFEINEEAVRGFFKTKYNKEVDSFEDLFKEPETKEVVKEVNPYEDVFDEYDKTYYQFKKDTGLSRKEFDFVQQDLSKKSSLDWAYEKVRKNNPGVNLTDSQINNYLETSLNIDLSSDELQATDLIHLNAFAKDFKDSQLQLQNKYKTTVNPKQPTPQVEMVTLENGEKMEKGKYEKLVSQRNEYINGLKQGVSGATSFDIEFAFDNDGEKQTSTFNYEYSDEDKHGMLSNASDINNFISKKFRTETGFDYKGLASFIDKAENFDKYAALIFNQARAEALAQKIEADNNENFDKTPKRETNTKNTTKSILDLVPNN